MDEAQLDELINFIDYDGDGNVTFMEFVAAFGLALCPRLDEDNDAEDSTPQPRTSHLAPRTSTSDSSPNPNPDPDH